MTVYAKIENGVLFTAPNEPIEALKGRGFNPFDEGLIAQCLCGIITVDELITRQENIFKLADLQSQIDELDKKRVRAGFEPEVKDETTGQTWLEYYTAQIQDLRTQIAALA